jgi:hypothetical protein
VTECAPKSPAEKTTVEPTTAAEAPVVSSSRCEVIEIDSDPVSPIPMPIICYPPVTVAQKKASYVESIDCEFVIIMTGMNELVLISNRFDERVKCDHEYVMDPLAGFRRADTSDSDDGDTTPALRPFRSVNEACSSLMTYHVYYEPPKPVEEEQFDQVIDERCQHLLTRFDSMKLKYQSLIFKESMVSEK